MRKVRSRNFILIVCGVLLALLISFTLTKALMTVMLESKSEKKDDDILNYIITSSSTIKLGGSGNFIGVSPKVSGTSVSDFKVLLNGPGDGVKYSVKFCNTAKEDLVYGGLWEGEVSCCDIDGGQKSCESISVLGYIFNGKRVLKVGETISSDSCVELVVEAQFDGDTANPTKVFVEKYFLEMKID